MMHTPWLNHFQTLARYNAWATGRLLTLIDRRRRFRPGQLIAILPGYLLHLTYRIGHECVVGFNLLLFTR